MTSPDEADELTQARYLIDEGLRLQREADARFPLARAVELEGEIWEAFQEIQFVPPIGNLELMAIGWTTSVLRQTHLIFANCNSGYQDLLVPNLRVAFEHAIYVSILADKSVDESTLERLDISTFKNWEETLNNSAEISENEIIKFSSGLLGEVQPQRRRDDDWITKVEKVCQLFDDYELLYRQYRTFSSYVHPNFQSAYPYIFSHVFNREESFSPKPELHPGSFLFSCALENNVWALSALNEVLGTNHLEQYLEPMAEIAECDVLLRMKATNRR